MDRRNLTKLLTVAALAAGALPWAGSAGAQTKEVTIAHQDMMVPWRYAHAQKEVEKVTGTERIAGYLEPFDGERVLLMGALTVKKERQKPFSGGNEGVGAPTTSSDAVGIISSTGRGRARIEFPYPTIESDFDVMELRR